MRRQRSIGPFLFLLLLTACHGQSGPVNTKDTVLIRSSQGENLSVQVEVADTPALRAQGLMYRTELPEGTGMLFVFPSAVTHAFWMRNTPIPLDMIFISTGEVVSLIENAVPYDETHLQPDSSYTMTLEVPGGYASRHGVRVGDRVEWKH